MTRTNSYRLKEMNTLRRSNTADPKRSPSLKAVSFRSGSSPRPASEHIIFGGEDEERRRFFDTTSREVFETWGDRDGGASSPINKPASLRKRQSLQLLDLENQVSKLTMDNTELEHHNAQLAEESKRFQRQVVELDESLDKQKELLAKRDRELLDLQESVSFYRKEVARLSEANDSLGATNVSIQDAFKKDIANINKKYNHKRDQLNQLSKENSELQKQYSELQGGMEKIIRQEIKVAIQDKDAEIDKLKDELSKARTMVKKLQKEALAAATDAAQQIAHAQETGTKEVNKYLNLKPEEYFPTAWKDFTDQLYAWCTKFSKQSERSCLSLHRIADDWVRDRVEVVMLDDNGVRRLLKDKNRRQDVLAAMIMRIIREGVFTRYLFGLTAEERQKLNGLERHLSESGPPAAVNLWRATTLTLLSQRPTFQDKRTQEASVVVKDVVRALSGILPQPTQLSPNLVDELRAIVATAVQLSIEMRTQRAQYMVPAPPNPVYDNNGDNVSRVQFTRQTMRNRGPSADGSMPREEDLERERALVKLVMFPLVVQIGTQTGESYEEEKMVVPMEVLVARPGENVVKPTRAEVVPPMPPLPGKLTRSMTSAPTTGGGDREREREREREPVPGKLSRSSTSTNMERDPRINGNGVERSRDRVDPAEPKPGRIKRAETVGVASGASMAARGDRDELRREREYRERERQRRVEEREKRAEEAKRAAAPAQEDESSSSAGAGARRANRLGMLREAAGGTNLSPVPEGSQGSPESTRRVGLGVNGGRAAGEGEGRR